MTLNHIAFIMDGNRRYGQKRGIKISSSYSHGMKKFLDVLKMQVKYKITETSFFALSSENLDKRSEEELKIIFDLVKKFTTSKSIDKFVRSNAIRISLFGDIEELKERKGLRQIINKFEKVASKIKEPKYFVNVALNYDGQEEIISAVKKSKSKKEISKEAFQKELWFQPKYPLDIVVRPGDAPRLSGFLLWHASYAELFFLKKLWPEFEERDLKNIINQYSKIKRNFGK